MAITLKERLLSGTAMTMVDYDNEPDSEQEYEEICQLFEDFHGYPPDESEDSGDIIEYEDGRILMLVGDLTRIGYETKEADEATGLREAIHTFGRKKKSDRPLLYVDVDGQAVIVQGNYTFTDRGFEDSP